MKLCLVTIFLIQSKMMCLGDPGPSKQIPPKPRLQSDLSYGLDLLDTTRVALVFSGTHILETE